MNNLLEKMRAHRRTDSWAVWETDAQGALTGSMTFPREQARAAVHSDTILIALNPGGTAEDGEAREDWGNFHAAEKKHNDHLLAGALLGTPLWGSYIADLLHDVYESDSTKVKTGAEVKRLAVEALVKKANLLGAERIVCLGSQSSEAVRQHLSLLEEGTGITPAKVHDIWHYSGANAGKHKHDPAIYRRHIQERLGLA